MKRLFSSKSPLRSFRKSKKEAITEEPSPLTDDNIAVMIELESELISGKGTKQIVHDLKMVEHYDGHKDPIKKYFNEKIQSIMGLSLLLKDSSPQKDVEKLTDQSTVHQIIRPARDLKKQRQVRSRQWKFHQDYQDKRTEEGKSIDKMMSSHKHTIKVNDNLINESLNNQQQRVMERLRQRQEHSFSRSISRSRISPQNIDKSPESKLGKPVFQNKRFADAEEDDEDCIEKIESPGKILLSFDQDEPSVSRRQQHGEEHHTEQLEN